MKYSVILPVYNEQENITEIFKRVTKVLSKLDNSYEIIFINDGSRDKTESLLHKLNKKDAHVKIISFSRNFGHQTAVTAGLDYSSGKYIAIMDADLQDPPEVLPQFFAKLKEGYNVAYAIRKKRKEGIIKKISYSTFYRLLKRIANINIPLDSGDFCVMDRTVVDMINGLPERNRFIRGLRSWVGFRQIGIEYERDSRHAGQSKYTLKKLFKLAFDGIFSFSYTPLKIMMNLGFILLLVSVFGSFLVIYMRFFTQIFVPGFATTIILIMFFGGLQMFSLGIMGEYIGRIYDEVKLRPNYVIWSTRGFKKNEK